MTFCQRRKRETKKGLRGERDGKRGEGGEGEGDPPSLARFYGPLLLPPPHTGNTPGGRASDLQTQKLFSPSFLRFSPFKSASIRFKQS